MHFQAQGALNTALKMQYSDDTVQVVLNAGEQAGDLKFKSQSDKFTTFDVSGNDFGITRLDLNYVTAVPTSGPVDPDVQLDFASYRDSNGTLKFEVWDVVLAAKLSAFQSLSDIEFFNDGN